MIAAILSLTLLGAVLGLGVAARKFAVEGDPLVGGFNPEVQRRYDASVTSP